MKPGTKVKIIDTSGQFPEGLMGVEGIVISLDVIMGRSMVDIPNEGNTWIYDFRLEEVEDDD